MTVYVISNYSGGNGTAVVTPCDPGSLHKRESPSAEAGAPARPVLAGGMPTPAQPQWKLENLALMEVDAADDVRESY